jgi:polysaccharide pyruvyl transferase WcaK-like protein
MKRFARWLVDNGYTVRLTVGDTNGSDDAVVQEILADVRESRPGLDPARVTAQPVVSYADVMAAMLPAGSVVAIRFHNILAALKLGKPTIGISYSPKHDALMAEMGLSGFCQPVNPFDYELLVQRFTELTSRSAELRKATAERSEANQKLLRQQFSELSAVLFPAHRPAPAAEHETSTSNGINARR